MATNMPTTEDALIKEWKDWKDAMEKKYNGKIDLYIETEANCPVTVMLNASGIYNEKVFDVDFEITKA